MSDLTVGLLGDVMLGRSVAGELLRREPPDLWSGEVRAICAGCDAVICNLECCISERGTPTRLIRGKPFFFRGPKQAVEALAAVGVDAVGVANNHALDYGPDALLDTLDVLDRAGIAAAGAGADAGSARRGIVIEAAGSRIGLLAASDHPAEYAAGADKPGIGYGELARGLPEWAARELGRLAGDADFVLAFPHWGPNMTTRPRRWQRELASELVEAGADLVAGHSAHVFHGVERHRAGLAAYDLGDALDDYRVDPDLRNDLGLLALWHPGGSPELEFVPLALDYCHTRLADDDQADWIEVRLERACSALGTRVQRADPRRFVLA